MEVTAYEILSNQIGGMSDGSLCLIHPCNLLQKALRIPQ